MKSPTRFVVAFALLVIALASCSSGRPNGPDPHAGIYLYPTEINPATLYEADLPLRVFVENWGDQPFNHYGHLAVTRDGSLVDTIPFGKLAPGGTPSAQVYKKVTVHEACIPGQQKVFTATVKYDPSITAKPDQIDVNFMNNQMSTDDVCQVIYQRFLNVFCEQCLKKVNSLRALEVPKLPALAPPSPAHQSCSNADAKANYFAGDPHAQQCGQAQNTCPQYPSFDEVLSTCIEQQMYYYEKKVYLTISGCEPLKWPNGCGHYINMTDKNSKGYKEVACGVFVTPSGAPYVVLNFFT